MTAPSSIQASNDSAVSGETFLPLAAVASEDRTRMIVPLLVTAVVCVVAMLTITPWPVGAFEDDGIYAVLARSLASGDGYRLTNLPGSPAATHYPPGYPLLLSILWRLSPEFPANVALLKFANAVLLSLAALGTWWYARRRLQWSSVAAGVVAVISTLSILVLYVTGMLLSEPMFLALLMPTLLVAEESVESGSWQTAALAGVLLGTLALVRTLGAFAIPVAALVLLHRRHVRAAVALVLTSAVFIVPWQLWTNTHAASVPPVLVGKFGSYGQWVMDGYRSGGFSFLGDVVSANVRGLLGMLGYVIMPVRVEWLRLLAFVTIAAATFTGGTRLLPRAPVTVGFFAAYMAIVLLWPFDANRFLWAVWPVFIVMLWHTASLAILWRPSRAGLRIIRGATLVLIAAPVAGFLVYNVRGYRGQWWASIQSQVGQRARPIVEWVDRYTSPSDVVATEHDLIVHLYTGRRAVPVSTFIPAQRVRPLTGEEDLDALRSLVETYNPRFVIVGLDQSIASADSLSRESPALLRPVGRIEGAHIYERLTSNSR